MSILAKERNAEKAIFRSPDNKHMQHTPIKLGILGCRGIPNQYGGFEAFAEHLSVVLAGRRMDVWVYNSHNHPCKDKVWRGVNRILCYDPEYRTGQFGQFIYDLNCISDSRKRNFDVILQLGYTSNSIWHFLLPKQPLIVTNMDGQEWKRNKYSMPVRNFLKYAEKLAVSSSDHLIADNSAIKEYLMAEYKVSATYIPYGAEFLKTGSTSMNTVNSIDISINNRLIKLYHQNFFLVIARLQPDNHIEEIIQGVLMAATDLPLVIVGNDSSGFATTLKRRYASEDVLFAGGIFNKALLDKLRSMAKLYFHGHSAGGTNPSLLEAMAASACICAHDNPFNRAVLDNDASYFIHPKNIKSIIQNHQKKPDCHHQIQNNLKKIKETYSWEKICNSYERLINKLLEKQHTLL